MRAEAVWARRDRLAEIDPRDRSVVVRHPKRSRLWIEGRVDAFDLCVDDFHYLKGLRVEEPDLVPPEPDSIGLDQERPGEATFDLEPGHIASRRVDSKTSSLLVRSVWGAFYSVHSPEQGIRNLASEPGPGLPVEAAGMSRTEPLPMALRS